ncbi:hypothetical protein GCM10027595_18100 [Corynebacterium nasicanis]
MILLQSVLAVLRSGTLSDKAARVEAERIASDGVLTLRNDPPKSRGGIEPVDSAFRELEEELATLVRHEVLTFDLVPPPEGGRALPVSVANAARDVVRQLVLISLEDHDVSRVRIKWDCDGTNLLVEFRDDGAGGRERSDDIFRHVSERIERTSGRWDVNSTAGWGSLLNIVFPLDEPRTTVEELDGLTDAQREVLSLVIQGKTNAEIASHLHLSTNTIKYHVGNLMKKFKVTRRTELAVQSLTRSRAQTR